MKQTLNKIIKKDENERMMEIDENICMFLGTNSDMKINDKSFKL
jgi:hypothetical protein